MGAMVKLTISNSNDNKELVRPVWVNADQILKMSVDGKTRITINDGIIVVVNETPDEIIRRINWAEAKHKHLVQEMSVNMNLQKITKEHKQHYGTIANAAFNDELNEGRSEEPTVCEQGTDLDNAEGVEPGEC